MKSKQPPLLRCAWTGEVYIVTRYRVRGVADGRQVVVASTKFPVGDADFERVVREYKRAKRRAARRTTR